MGFVPHFIVDVVIQARLAGEVLAVRNKVTAAECVRPEEILMLLPDGIIVDPVALLQALLAELEEVKAVLAELFPFPLAKGDA